MLPIQDEDFKGHSRAVHVASAARYFRRMLRLRHMDFDHTLWLMLNLCVNPRHVYRSATYHRGTKNMWARDDPAFVVLLLYLLLVSVVAWSMGFGRFSPLSYLSLALYVLLVDFALIGGALATLCWWLANTHLIHREGRTQRQAGEELSEHSDRVEWLYALDVHCNGFFVLSMILHVAQYALLPLLLQDGFRPAAASNTLFAAGLTAYCYIVFLGYNELPFLRMTEVFVYPIGLILTAWVGSLILAALNGFSCTWLVASIYFQDDEVASAYGY